MVLPAIHLQGQSNTDVRDPGAAEAPRVSFLCGFYVDTRDRVWLHSCSVYETPSRHFPVLSVGLNSDPPQKKDMPTRNL